MTPFFQWIKSIVDNSDQHFGNLSSEYHISFVGIFAQYLDVSDRLASPSVLSAYFDLSAKIDDVWRSTATRPVNIPDGISITTNEMRQFMLQNPPDRS